MILAQLTDLHLPAGDMAASLGGDPDTPTERAFRAVAHLRTRPHAIVVSGDLTEDGRPAEYARLGALMRRHVPGLPVYLIPGNHDRRDVMRAEMAAWPGVTQDPAFVQYAVDDLPVRLVMLDTVVSGQVHGLLGERRLAWLDAALARAPHRPTMIVMHHPPLHCGVPQLDAINLQDSAAFAAVVARHRQVDRILCGHHHRPIIGRVAQATVLVGPSVAYDSEPDLFGGAPGLVVAEPPAFQLHLWTARDGIVSHTVGVDPYPPPSAA